MAIPKESAPAAGPGMLDTRSQEARPYIPPEAQKVSVENIDQRTMCACRAGDDNPY